MPDNLAELQRMAVQKAMESLEKEARFSISITSCDNNSCNGRAAEIVQGPQAPTG